MNDAEFLRKEAHGWREEARERASHGDHDLQEEATQRADRLTALADRLDGGVIVPREPTEAMLTAIREAHWESSGCQFCAEDYRAAYRAMLASAEAK